MRKIGLLTSLFLTSLSAFAQPSNSSGAGYVHGLICRAVVTEHQDLFESEANETFQICMDQGVVDQKEAIFFVSMKTKKGVLGCEATLDDSGLSKTPSVILSCQEFRPKPGMGVSN